MDSGEDEEVPRESQSAADVDADADADADADTDADEETVFLEDSSNSRTGATNASVAVVNAVSDGRGVDPLDLPPLYTAIEPDALDAIFADDGLSSVTWTGTVSFEYADCMVIVDGNGDVSAESFSE